MLTPGTVLRCRGTPCGCLAKASVSAVKPEASAKTTQASKKASTTEALWDSYITILIHIYMVLYYMMVTYDFSIYIYIFHI